MADSSRLFHGRCSGPPPAILEAVVLDLALLGLRAPFPNLARIPLRGMQKTGPLRSRPPSPALLLG